MAVDSAAISVQGKYHKGSSEKQSSSLRVKSLAYIKENNSSFKQKKIIITDQQDVISVAGLKKGIKKNQYTNEEVPTAYEQSYD